MKINLKDGSDDIPPKFDLGDMFSSDSFEIKRKQSVKDLEKETLLNIDRVRDDLIEKFNESGLDAEESEKKVSEIIEKMKTTSPLTFGSIDSSAACDLFGHKISSLVASFARPGSDDKYWPRHNCLFTCLKLSGSGDDGYQEACGYLNFISVSGMSCIVSFDCSSFSGSKTTFISPDYVSGKEFVQIFRNILLFFFQGRLIGVGLKSEKAYDAFSISVVPFSKMNFKLIKTFVDLIDSNQPIGQIFLKYWDVNKTREEFSEFILIIYNSSISTLSSVISEDDFNSGDLAVLKNLFSIGLCMFLSSSYFCDIIRNIWTGEGNDK